MRRIGSIVLAFAALAVLALAVGFVVFSDRVARQEVPDDPSAGGIVVSTGGRARIDVGLDLLAGGHAQRLLVSGVNPAVDRKALAKVVDADKLAAMSCCIDLRHDARDTAGNAAETLAWLTRHGFTSLIVVTSDNGMPFPRAKANLYDFGTRMPMAVSWPGTIEGGRTVTDFVSFADFAPTFMEAAGLAPHEEMSGRSFLDVLMSGRDGRVDAGRDRAHCGRERHTIGRQGDVGYPVRSLRTDEFLYILNYEPERWPAGAPPMHHQDVDQSITKDYMTANADRKRVCASR